jgi:DNA-binding NarL/FixJ family response regulator
MMKIEWCLHLLEKGVSGYLLKDAEAGEVEKAIRKVMDEGVYLNGVCVEGDASQDDEQTDRQ